MNRFTLASLTALFTLVLSMPAAAQNNTPKTLADKLGYPPGAKLVIIHADDVGVTHSSNEATTKALETGLVNSASIMVPCPWFPEIVDGRWIAYASREGRESSADPIGSFRVFVRPAQAAGSKYPISTDGGTLPTWSPDGRTIFYLQCGNQCNKMMAVEIETEPEFRASQPRVLFESDFLLHDANFGSRNYDISPDGQRFLMVQSEEEPPPLDRIKIVLNWHEELKRLVPTEN